MKLQFKTIKALLKPIMSLPLHPQWHTASRKLLIKKLVAVPPRLVILDIGCYDKWPQQYLSDKCHYIGADYPDTATNWYHSRPDLFTDGHKLPLATASIDRVLAFDVLEHLEDPQSALMEINRVLSDNGEAIIKIPFMYPLHDQPRDFSRLTPHGMKYLANKSNLSLKSTEAIGSAIETAALLKNIAAVTLFTHWIKKRNPLSLLIFLLPIYVLLQNIISYVINKLGEPCDIMPHSYIFVLHKKTKCTKMFLK